MCALFQGLTQSHIITGLPNDSKARELKTRFINMQSLSIDCGNRTITTRFPRALAKATAVRYRLYYGHVPAVSRS